VNQLILITIRWNIIVLNVTNWFNIIVWVWVTEYCKFIGNEIVYTLGWVYIYLHVWHFSRISRILAIKTYFSFFYDYCTVARWQKYVGGM